MLYIFLLFPSLSSAFLFGGGGGGGCGCSRPPPPPCGCGAPLHPPPVQQCPLPPLPPPPPSCGSSQVQVQAAYSGGYNTAPNAPFRPVPQTRYDTGPPLPPPIPPPASRPAAPVYETPSDPVPISRPAAVPQGYEVEEKSSLDSYGPESSVKKSRIKPREDSLLNDYEAEISDPPTFLLRRAQAVKTAKKSKCSNKKLAALIIEHIRHYPDDSKSQLAAAAKAAFGYNFDVICSREEMNFLISSSLFCEGRYRDTVCLVFQH